MPCEVTFTLTMIAMSVLAGLVFILGVVIGSKIDRAQELVETHAGYADDRAGGEHRD